MGGGLGVGLGIAAVVVAIAVLVYAGSYLVREVPALLESLEARRARQALDVMRARHEAAGPRLTAEAREGLTADEIAWHEAQARAQAVTPAWVPTTGVAPAPVVDRTSPTEAQMPSDMPGDWDAFASEVRAGLGERDGRPMAPGSKLQAPPPGPAIEGEGR
jgi:hypothetical protein